jgi:hypothetical protein
MDWDHVYSPPPPANATPAPTLLETCWRLRAPSGRIITCGIYRDSARGVEVRTGFSDDDLLRSERAAEIGNAREIAARWRAAVLAKGGFAEAGDGTKGGV